MKRVIQMIMVLCIIGTFVQAQENTVEINILHTGDEHSWMRSFKPSRFTSTLQGGAANIYSWWLENEGYDPDTFLLLSSGDDWTGPAISTWFEGQPMVEAFNLMAYDASAIGNHEFDFGRDVMAQRFEEALYPYLAANIRDAVTGELADFATPYVILELKGYRWV